MPSGQPPEGVVLAEQSKLAHIKTYGELPILSRLPIYLYGLWQI